MPYIDKNGKPVLWEETDYFNQYRKALIYYPVKAKRISGVPDCDFTYEILVSPTPTPTQTGTPTQTPTSSVTPTQTPTQTGTPTPTPTPSAPSIDPDAAAYLADVVASGGTTNPTIEAAVDTLFTELKNNGLYSKIYAMYPYVGGTASSHSINALLNKTYDITWIGGMTHGISGSTGNGTNAYGDTGFNPYVEIGSTAGIPSHASIYVGTETDGNYGDFGQRDGSNTLIMAVSYGNSYYGWHYTAGGGGSPLGEFVYVNNDAKGNYIQSRIAIDNAVAYKNGVLQNTRLYTETNSAPNGNLRVFNDGLNYSNRRLQFTTIGDGLSAGEIVILDNIINTFQTSLGRNIY